METGFHTVVLLASLIIAQGENLTVRTGQQVVLKCRIIRAGGHYMWTRCGAPVAEGSRYRFEGGDLVIQRAYLMDQGLWACHWSKLGQNGPYQNSSDAIRLVVQDDQSQRLVLSQKILQAPEDEDVERMSNVKDKVDCFWERNGVLTRVPSSDRKMHNGVTDCSMDVWVLGDKPETHRCVAAGNDNARSCTTRKVTITPIDESSGSLFAQRPKDATVLFSHPHILRCNFKKNRNISRCEWQRLNKSRESANLERLDPSSATSCSVIIRSFNQNHVGIWKCVGHLENGDEISQTVSLKQLQDVESREQCSNENFPEACLNFRSNEESSPNVTIIISISVPVSIIVIVIAITAGIVVSRRRRKVQQGPSVPSGSKPTAMFIRKALPTVPTTGNDSDYLVPISHEQHFGAISTVRPDERYSQPPEGQRVRVTFPGEEHPYCVIQE